jgi:hypothetical protein
MRPIVIMFADVSTGIRGGQGWPLCSVRTSTTLNKQYHFCILRRSRYRNSRNLGHHLPRQAVHNALEILNSEFSVF